MSVCEALHEWANSLPVFCFPFDANANRIPPNGIYVLFEQGEIAHGTNCIVRVGTHTGNNQLPSRLRLVCRLAVVQSDSVASTRETFGQERAGHAEMLR